MRHEYNRHAPICLFLLVPHSSAVLFCACRKITLQTEAKLLTAHPKAVFYLPPILETKDMEHKGANKMTAALLLKNDTNPTSQPNPLFKTHLLVDGNSHRSDLAARPEEINAPCISEALLPQIRLTAMLIAAMRHQADRRSPDVFTDEADWFAARILVLNVRKFHLDITLLPMLKTANQRAQMFAEMHNLSFTPAAMHMSLHAGRPSGLLIIETEQQFIQEDAGLIANSRHVHTLLAAK